MNKYDELYTYRLATINDVDKIMDFIRSEWKENHILSYDRELFLWQYDRSEYDDYENINFVLMEDVDDNLVGILGYIAYSNELDDMHISPSITKVKDKGLLPLSGVELIRRRVSLVGETVYFAHGANSKTIVPLYERTFHNKTGIMEQYYMLNPNTKKYTVAIADNPVFYKSQKNDILLHEFEDIDEIDFNFYEKFERMPYKSKEFIIKRYFNHPIYNYKKWALSYLDCKCVGVLFGREIVVNDVKILRLVDFIGELKGLYSCGSHIDRIMQDNNYEYVDLMADSLDADLMLQNGFIKLDLEGDTIIPNYFEPFVQCNIKDYYHKNADVVIFKADGDQDRPNMR